MQWYLTYYVVLSTHLRFRFTTRSIVSPPCGLGAQSRWTILNDARQYHLCTRSHSFVSTTVQIADGGARVNCPLRSHTVCSYFEQQLTQLQYVTLNLAFNNYHICSFALAKTAANTTNCTKLLLLLFWFYSTKNILKATGKHCQ